MKYHYNTYFTSPNRNTGPIFTLVLLMLVFHDAFNQSEIPAINRQTAASPADSHKRHAWGIKYPASSKDMTAYNNSIRRITNQYISLRGNSVYMSLGNYRIASGIFTHRRDGLALEIVSFDKYNCSDDLYYTLPRRKNRGCIFEGKVTRPVYRQELLNKENTGNKKKNTRGNYTMFVGKIPENTPHPYELNILVLKKNRICDVIYTHHLCGELFNNFVNPPFYCDFDMPDTEKYVPDTKMDTLKLRIYYDVNETAFTDSVLTPVKKLLTDKSRSLIKAKLISYASIEGTGKINQELYTERMNKILSEINPYRHQSFKLITAARENWTLFYRQIKNSRYQYFSKLDTLQTRNILNNPDSAFKFKPMLDAQRYSELILYTVPVINDSNIDSFALEEYADLFGYHLLKCNSSRYYKIPDYVISRMSAIFDFLLTRLQENKINLESLESLPVFLTDRNGLTGDYQPFISLAGKLLFFKCRFYPEKMTDDILIASMSELMKFKDIDPLIIYNYHALSIKNTVPGGYRSDSKLKELQKTIGYLRNKVPEFLMDSLELFYHFQNAAFQFGKNPYNYRKYNISLRYIYNYYMAHILLTEYRTRLARYFIEFRRFDQAYNMLLPAINSGEFNKEAYILYLKLFYSGNVVVDDPEYYNKLIKAAGILNADDWVNLFRGDCRINFQVFDYEDLWKLFCRQLEKSTFTNTDRFLDYSN